MNIYMICTLWTLFQAERDWKNSYREILLIPLYIVYSLWLKLFSSCINSEFRQILSLCHCQVLLSKRSFLLIFIFGTPRGGKRTTTPLGTPLCLTWGREMQADVILKEPPPWVPPLSLSEGGTRRGGRGERPPPRKPLISMNSNNVT